ncbi:TlpA disulfide reductase family protein [Wukongibacter baidiensis]|uniref:TlpA disulfide reductase family protein n=1 Tax=Wukongibacter baidiensis TaxID=1723361 RepID=UPI003D7FE74A
MKKVFSLLLVGLLSVVLIAGCTNKENVEIDKEKAATEEEKNIEKTVEIDENNEGKTEEDEEVKEGIFPGDKAYDFTLLDREGNEISLSSLKGKVVFLNFWASWCGPCRAEMPHMQKVHEEYNDEDVVILAVNVTAVEKNGIEDVNTYLDENKFTFPVLYDKDGAVATQYRVGAFPTTYIINKEGIIVNFITGAMSDERMKAQIEAAKE